MAGGDGVGSLKLFSVKGVRDGGVHGIGLTVWFRNKVEAEGGEERSSNFKKNVLVMKCNKNVNIPYCWECLSVNTR